MCHLSQCPLFLFFFFLMQVVPVLHLWEGVPNSCTSPSLTIPGHIPKLPGMGKEAVVATASFSSPTFLQGHWWELWAGMT